MRLHPAPTTVIAAVTVVSLALVPFRDVFQGTGWAYRIVLGTLIAAAIATLLESIRWRASVPALAAITAIGALLWSLVVMAESFRRAPLSTEPWGDVWSGLFHGWSALLDDQVPLRDAPSAGIFVAIVAWVVTALAVHLAARHNTALAAIGGASVLLWLAVAAALPSGLAHAAVGATVGCAALAMIATTTRATDNRWRSGRVVSLMLVIGTAGLVAAVVGQTVTRVGADPSDPRASRDITIVATEVPDILAEFSASIGDDSPVLSVVSSTGGQLPELRLRLQVYDVHDGERWLPSTDFRDVAAFPQASALPPGEVVRLEISVSALAGPWIPLPDRVVGTDLTDIRWNESTQTALRSNPLRRYLVTGTVVGRSGLEGLDGAREEVDPVYAEVPAALPDSIRVNAQRVAGTAPDAITAGDALTNLVRELGRDDSVVPGHSLGRLRDDLEKLEPTGVEQLASIHALMARSLGIPARVVVGYIANDNQVVASDLHVWTELAFPEVGWVAFDPVPRQNEGPSETSLDTNVTSTTVPEDTVVQARALPRQLEPDGSSGESDFAQDDDQPWNDPTTILLTLLVVSLLTMLSIRVIRRRVRRSHRDIQPRILGAWAELVDRMREAGAPVARTTTVNDIVYMAAEMDPELGEEAEALGAIASLALHGPRHCTPEQASDAWETLKRAERILVSVRGRRATLGRLVDPRVLRHRAPVAPRARGWSARPSVFTEQSAEDRSR